jgi:hypothetical protein
MASPAQNRPIHTSVVNIREQPSRGWGNVVEVLRFLYKGVPLSSCLSYAFTPYFAKAPSHSLIFDIGSFSVSN